MLLDGFFHRGPITALAKGALRVLDGLQQDVEDDDPRLAFYRRFNLQWDLADQDEDAVNLLSLPMKVRDLQAVPLPSRLTLLP